MTTQTMDSNHIAKSKITAPIKSKIDCPICDSKAQSLLYRPWVSVDDPVKLYGAASGIQGTQTIVKCDDCSMIFESPRYPEEVILQGYMSAENEGHDSQFKMRVESFFRTLNKLKNLLPKPQSRVLDIGTAGGAFLEAAQRFGYNIEGLEPSMNLVENGKARGFQIFQGTIATNSLPEKSYDMVCLWDVIEHVCNPKNDLIKIRNLLKPDGILFINYPDIGTLPAKLAGKKFWWILSVHLHHFDRNSIREIAKRSGYEVVAFKPYWQTLQLGYLFHIAAHLKVPLAGFIEKILPNFIKKIPVSYYASQTSAILKIRKDFKHEA